ncbi:MAG: helix-turn-helix domain-containing protein [Oscillospiraceae bacterium]|nr:helix-turn-helix domain-containing protein [Oscillospiraceae bacterium]
MKNFAEHLKYIRTSKGFTQRQVAEGTKIAERIIIRYERGAGKPSFDKLWALADFFDVSVDYLMGRDWNPPN